MTTKELKALCDAAERYAKRKRTAERPSFVVRIARSSTRGLLLVPDAGDSTVDVPILHGEIEAAGDGEQFETLARFACGDVRLFLEKLEALVQGPVELRLA